MKRFFAVLLAMAICVPAAMKPAPVLAALNPLSHCGTERWHIKTLDDTGVNHITQTPATSTVGALRTLSVPSGYSKSNDTSRYAPEEFTKYTVTARIVGFKEESDRDIHVEIADPQSGKTMIAEIPDPGCSTVKESGHQSQIAAVRSAFIACFGNPPASSAFKTLDGTTVLRLTGVGFFDFIHSQPQIGVAPNAIELHPLLGITPVSGKCGKVGTNPCACAVTRSSTPTAMPASLPRRRPEPTTSHHRQFRQP
jgi:hypothetical protein